jgi:hypothetical protein
MERGVLVQRSMGPRLIIVGSVRTYDSAQVRLTEYDHVVRAPVGGSNSNQRYSFFIFRL